MKRFLTVLLSLLLLTGTASAVTLPPASDPPAAASPAPDGQDATTTPEEPVSPAEEEPSPAEAPGTVTASPDGAPSPETTPSTELTLSPEQKFKTLLIWSGAVLLFLIAVLTFIALLRKRRNRRRKNGTMKLRNAEPGGIRAVNLQGLGGRENQQDSFGVTDVKDSQYGVFAVVADGMGGGADGAEVSGLVVSHMLEAFRSGAETTEPPALLLRMVSEAQSKARSFISQRGDAVSGSTLVAAVVKSGELYFVSVGDSRICLLRGGAAVQLNREHIFASELDEKAARGVITLEAARNDPQRASLTSFIGTRDRLQTDGNANPIQLVPGDRLLLMTDGVFGTVTERELTEAATLPNVYEAAAEIERVIIAKRKPNQDNFTAVILEV
ncbi:MAG: protein phosphatase 2C domain-containing protein [Oscillospiraceae bacterium]|nr:protein phosphatase 2C domain-containing protein [Oscillospiraceae bacterium]